MSTCIVPGCIKKKKKENVCLFKFPKKDDLLRKWLDAIPGIKPPIKSSWRVCQNHFKTEYILKYFSHIIDGEVYLLKRGRAKLEANAVPTENLQPPTDIATEVRKSKSQNTEQSEDSTVEDKCTQNSCLSIDRQSDSIIQSLQEVFSPPQQQQGTAELMQGVNLVFDISNAEISKENIKSELSCSLYEAEEPFESLFDNVFEVVLPTTLWGVHRSTNRNRVMFACIDEDQLNISKMLVVDDKDCISDTRAGKGNGNSGSIKMQCIRPWGKEGRSTTITPDRSNN
ncbi:uncharacterized protein [Eurosta solidaginis]|uniref:uncharacterized protein n=1 Tax=Eurosta solidaginis TaxID=178769 RepID=UPI0035310477